MLKIVLDTNVLVSAFIAYGNEYELLKQGKLGRIKIIISPEIFEEFKEVIRRPKFGFSDEQIESFVKQVSDIIEMIFPSVKFEVVKDDPDDIENSGNYILFCPEFSKGQFGEGSDTINRIVHNKILDAAVEAKADYIVSGDLHLLKLKEFKGIGIITASQFFEITD